MENIYSFYRIKAANFRRISSLLFIFLIFYSVSFAQKVVIIGVNYSNGTTRNDAVAFVATEIIPAGTVLYFTDYEYNATTNVFGDAGAMTTTESVIKYTVTTPIPKGIVISLRFTTSGVAGETPPITKASSTGTDYGSAIFLATINGQTTQINYRTAGESVYAYSDNDDNPVNGITEIFSVFYGGSESGNNSGGNIPINESPVPDFPNAIVVDGFTPGSNGYPTSGDLGLMEFNANRASATSRSTLENIGNYTTTGLAASNPNVTAFTNIFPSAVLPIITVTTTATSINENIAGTITYIFSINNPAAGNIAVNFTVSGTAGFGTDYTQTGATSFNTTTGTITILNGATTASLQIDPTGDATLEPNETVVITVQSVASVYDAGSPSVGNITIVNDDTGTSVPKVALVGINHADPSVNPGHIDGFSFVALEDLAANTVVYFTRRIYDKTTLRFNSTYTGTLKWTAGTGVNRGDVYTVMETTADAFTITCSDGSSCGTITNIDAGFNIPTSGIGLYAYADNNDNPTDVVTEIYSLLYTGDIAVASNGGLTPTNQNPALIYPNAVVIEGFPNAVPGRTEFKFAPGSILRQQTVTRTNLVNTASNWLHAQSTATAPSIERFSNIIVTSGTANPTLTVSLGPSSVTEDGASNLVYNFTLSQNATTNITVNFAVSGTSTFNNDYTQSGASAFTITTGSVTILSGSNSASVTINPTTDATLEPNETVIITIDSGTGYDAGSPNTAVGIITNDDVKLINAKVVIIGINSGNETNIPTSRDPDGFSFVANEALPASTVIYFTDSPFNNTSLLFTPIEGIVKFTVGSGGLAKGQVVYLQETGPLTNTFAITCTAGNNCGSATMVNPANGFSLTSGGDNLYAYSDTDDDPTNGVTDIHSLFYTINTAIPTIENPKIIYPNAIVISGFGSASPDRTEYRFAGGERAANTSISNMENTVSYLIGQGFQTLSLVPFTNLNLCSAVINTQPSNAIANLQSSAQFTVVAFGPNLIYQWQVNIGTGFTNITTGGIYTGFTSNTLILSNIPCNFTGYQYRCIVNNCVTSEAKTLTVTTIPSPTTSNNGLNFDGVNDFVIAESCTPTPFINGGSAITVEYWFKGSNIQSAVRTQDVSNNYMVAGWSFPPKHILSNDGGTSGGVDVGAAATDGNWHHVAFTWQQGATNGFKSYLDGQLVQQRNALNIPLPNINSPLILGSLQGSSEFMNGTIDEVRVWSVARNQAQIQTGMIDFESKFPLPQAGLLAYYKFDIGIANGNNSTLIIPNNATNNFIGIPRNFANTGAVSNIVAGVLQEVEWLGSVDGNWTNPANWTGNQLPNISSTVIIGAGRPNYPTQNVRGSINKLKVNTGGSITIPTNQGLTIWGQ